MTFYKATGFFLAIFLILSCNPEDSSRGRDTDDSPPRSGDRAEDFKNRGLSIETFLDRRYDGGYYYDSYTGEPCEEDSRCRYICENKVLSKAKNHCYRAPKALVEDLEDGFFALVSIGDPDSVDISPALLAGILDIHNDLVLDLVENKMSEGDIKSFLAWVAVSDDIAQVFYQEDRRAKVLKEAFKRLGDFKEESSKDIRTGLNTGLISEEDSFFYLSAMEDNEAAFLIVYKILQSTCSSRDCKMDILCARKLEHGRRSRILREDSSRYIECRTASNRRRRTRRDAICYIHGSLVWSYIDELIEEDTLRAGEFSRKPVTVAVCNEHCGSRDSGKCPLIH